MPRQSYAASFRPNFKTLSAQEIEEKRANLPATQIDSNNEPEREKFGISHNFKRIYLKAKKSDEELLDSGLKCKATADILANILHETIREGKLVNPEEQQMLHTAADLMGKLQKYAAFNLREFEYAREQEERNAQHKGALAKNVVIDQ